jgi:hypothetical protein
MRIIIILSTLILLLITVLTIVVRQLQTVKEERDQAIDYTLQKDDSIQYLKTKNGQVSAKAYVQELTIRNLKKLSESKDLAWIKQFEGVHKRLNNVEQATKLTADVVGNFKIPLRDTTIINLDSSVTKAHTFNNKDKWFPIKGIIFTDSITTTSKIPVPLESILLWERPHRFLGIRFGKKSWSNQTSSPNPYVKITDNKIVRIGKK